MGLPQQVTLSISVESGSIANGSVLEITSQNTGLTFEPIQSGEAAVHSSLGNGDTKTLPYKVQTLTMHGYDDVTDTSVAMVTLPAVGPYAKIDFNLILLASLEKQSFQEEVREYKVCIFTAAFNNMRSTDECVFRFRQLSVWRLLPASDYCRARGNQIVEHNSDNGTVLGSSRKLRGASEHLIDSSEKRICRLSFEF